MKYIHARTTARRRLASRLLHGTAVAGLAAMSATAAAAQTSASDQAVETVTVTGTSIPGAAAVGANIITVDRPEIEASGATSIQQLLANVPSITGFGNPGQGPYGSGDQSGTAAPTIHSLGASASNSTLILVDGHRLPLSGLSHTLADPSTIPTIALQRVEVLPDGASSIYGSDAVAGVLNFITRKDYQGAETDLQYGDGLDYNSVNFGQILGTSWDKGSVMAAYNYTSLSQLAGSARNFVNDNQTFRGLSNFGNFTCGPATASPTGGAGAGLIYAYPYTGKGIVNAAANATCGQTSDSALLPSENLNTALISVHQQLSDWLDISADVNWSNRVDDGAVSRNPGAINGTGGTGLTATVFGPGSGKGAQINPFYVDVPGNTTGTQTVRLDFNSIFGPGAYLKLGTQIVYGNVDADIKLGGDWALSIDGLAGNSNNFYRDVGQVCAACAYLAVNGTTNAAGSLTASSTPATLGTTTITTRALTTANALNVWGALGSAAAGGANTSSPVLSQLLDNTAVSQTTQTLDDVNLKATGTLFQLPAGNLKTAFGVEYRHQGLNQYAVANSASGPSVTNSGIFSAAFGRSVYAAYAEFLVPLISEDAHVPLVEKLDVDLSGRYDHYSDFGGAQNPRAAVSWEIIDGLKARGSYSTSFVAPSLTSTGGAAGLSTESGVTYGAGAGGPVAVPAGYTNNGGGNSTTMTGFCAAGCVVGNATNQGIEVVGPGGPTVQPETALSYSAGADLDAGKFVDMLDGLTFTATYWQTKYAGAVTSPAMSLDTQLAALNKNLIVNPSNAQVAAALNSGGRVVALPSGPVTFIQYYVQQNAFNLYANGIDFGIHYVFSTADLGDFHVGLDGTDKLRFDQQGGGYGGTIVSNLNRNANATFSSLALTARGSLGWHWDAVTTNLFVNYVNPYYQPTATAPFTGLYRVPAYTTVDLNLGYDLPAFNPWASGTQVYVTANDLFNTAPPAYNIAAGYDASDASPIDRIVMFGVRKRW